MLEKYLEDLETRIKPEVENDLIGQWQDFWSNENNKGLFVPQRHTKSPSRLECPKIKINDALEDDTFETMAKLWSRIFRKRKLKSFPSAH